MSRDQQRHEPVPQPGGGLVRLRATLAYDGTDFHGWARQAGLASVQAVVEDAFATVLRVPAVSTVVAGRTDAGVHAHGQVVHVDAPASAWEALGGHRLLRGVNAVLPPDVRVRDVRAAPPGFDARFAATWRRYRYRVSDDPGGPDPLHRGHILWVPRRLDAHAMDAAVRPLRGLHDFAAFCKARAGAGTVREVLEVGWRRSDGDPGLLDFDIRADAFCHSMVRSIVGGSLLVGRGSRSAPWLAAALAAADRAAGVPVAPARGLALIDVGYPEPAGYLARAAVTRRRRSDEADAHGA